MPDIREKIKKYIQELNEEIKMSMDNLESNIVKEYKSEHIYVASMVRIDVLQEVVNDLTSRLDELV